MAYTVRMKNQIHNLHNDGGATDEAAAGRSMPAAAHSETDGQTAFFGSVEQALSFSAPQGSVVNAIGFERTDTFLELGYRVTDGDADIAIARGGLREFDAGRKVECKKLILVPTHAYGCAASDLYRTQDEAFAVTKRGKKPFAAVFDVSHADDNLASLFGEIAVLDLAAFDVTFGAYMRGENVDNALVTDVASLVTELTSELKANEKNRPEAAAALVRAGEKAARIVEAHPELPFTSGAAQAAEALRMLHTAEDRPLGMRGETEMVLASYVTDFYIKSLTVTPEFPPDNNKRIDSVCEYFHADIRRACIHATAIYPPIKMRLCEYRRDEFRAEQMRLLSQLKQRRLAAIPVFKRLYPDDGYSLRTLVDKADVGLCLALAPDVFAADTMLSFLKQTGRLEKYIV